MTDTWCVLPWTHVCVRPNEQVKPCCRFQFKPGEAERAPYLADFDPDNEFWTQLRTDMLAGVKRDECRKCYEQERVLSKDSRSKSLRQWMNIYNSTVTEDQCASEFLSLQYIEMSLDNLCNLECRMCDSKFSSKLQLRDEHMGWIVHKKLEPAFKKFDRYDLTKLRHIKLLGGEPLISPNLETFFDYLKQRGVQFENLFLQISTNGSRRVSDSRLEQLRTFGKIQINVSLDSYSSANDYQRVGSNYKEVFENALWYKANLNNSTVNFHTVIGVYTANHLHKTVAFILDKHDFDISVDFIRDPSWQSLLSAPEWFNQWVLEQNQHHPYSYKLLNNIIKEAEYQPADWELLIKNTEKLDNYYNTSLKNYNPEVYEKLYETHSI